jgi:hypothetical protein
LQHVADATTAAAGRIDPPGIVIVIVSPFLRRR